MVLDIPSLLSDLIWWEIAGYISLGIVTLGVAGESIADFTKWGEPRKKWLGKASALVLIMGLAGEGIAQSKTNSLSGLIIAGLGERTANAELELVRIKRPRIITPQKANDLVASLSKYSGGKKFWIIVDRNEIETETEQEALANKLREIFTQAHWILDPHTMKDRTKVNPSTFLGLNSGCTVSTETAEFASFIVQAFKDAKLDCRPLAPHSEMASDVIVIEIGQ